jgi:ferritin
MINKSIQDAMNAQIGKEISSAYLYLSMAAHFEAANWPGFAHWMKVQNQEEMTHAMKFFDFILSRGGQVVLPGIPQPPSAFTTHLAILEQTLEHEKTVTASINSLYELALKEKDYPSQIFLQWFINEQVEEEKNATEIVEKLKIIGDRTGAFFYLDKHLGNRGK